MDTAELLERERDEIVGSAVMAIRRIHLVHYEASGPGEVRMRIETLFDRLVESVERRDLAPMVTHVAKVADERFGAGFGLSEIQSAMNAVEEAAWARIVALMPPEHVGSSLGLVASVLGAGKDALARAYVSLATRSGAPAADLEALFAGTNPG